MKLPTLLALALLISASLMGQIDYPSVEPADEAMLISGRSHGELPLEASASRAACDIIQTITPEAGSPTGLAVVGDEIWVGNSSTGEIHHRDADGEWSIPLTLDVAISAIEYFDCHLYVVSEQLALLVKINVEDYTYTEHILPTQNPGDPNVFGVTYGGGFLWVSEYAIDSGSILYKLDLTTLESTSFVSMSGSILGMDWCDGTIYGIDPLSAELHHIDPETGEASESEDWCIDWAYDADFDGGNMWCISAAPTQGTGDIYEIDPGFECNTSNTPCSEVGITDLSAQAKSLNVYPNPALDMFTVDGLANGRIEVRDATGSVVLLTASTSIDCSSWPAGMYTVRVQDEEGVRFARMMKE